jgi:CRP-like cAMP-binding protein
LDYHWRQLDRNIMSKNRILALLPEEDRQKILSDSVTVSLPQMKRLYSRNDRIDAVYFPLDCVVSLVVTAPQAPPVEMATIGNEGAVGVLSVLNPAKLLGTTIIQVAGDAERIDVAKFHTYAQPHSVFETLIRRYLYALMNQIVQAGACNQVHTIEQRCARWLLMTHDRKHHETFLLTQEYLAEMLGVRRATVNLALRSLKAVRLIQYVRGQITIVDRAGLEAVSCPCYGLIRREYEEVSLQ